MNWFKSLERIWKVYERRGKGKEPVKGVSNG